MPENRLQFFENYVKALFLTDTLFCPTIGFKAYKQMRCKDPYKATIPGTVNTHTAGVVI